MNPDVLKTVATAGAEGSSDEVMMQNDALRPLKFQLIFCVSGAYSQTIMEYNESDYHKPNDTTNPRLPAPLWVWELGQLLLLVHKPTGCKHKHKPRLLVKIASKPNL